MTNPAPEVSLMYKYMGKATQDVLSTTATTPATTASRKVNSSASPIQNLLDFRHNIDASKARSGLQDPSVEARS